MSDPGLYRLEAGEEVVSNAPYSREHLEWVKAQLRKLNDKDNS